MKDNLIEFETAKLAKEKGFKLNRNPFGFIDRFYHPKSCNLLYYGRMGKLKHYMMYYAATQSLLQKWLREVHNLHLGVWYNTLTNKYRPELNGENLLNDSEYNTYEEALEQGLQQALKLIKI